MKQLKARYELYYTYSLQGVVHTFFDHTRTIVKTDKIIPLCCTHLTLHLLLVSWLSPNFFTISPTGSAALDRQFWALLPCKMCGRMMFYVISLLWLGEYSSNNKNFTRSPIVDIAGYLLTFVKNRISEKKNCFRQFCKSVGGCIKPHCAKVTGLREVAAGLPCTLCVKSRVLFSRPLRLIWYPFDVLGVSQKLRDSFDWNKDNYVTRKGKRWKRETLICKVCWRFPIQLAANLLNLEDSVQVSWSSQIAWRKICQKNLTTAYFLRKGSEPQITNELAASLFSKKSRVFANSIFYSPDVEAANYTMQPPLFCGFTTFWRQWSKKEGKLNLSLCAQSEGALTLSG